MEAEETEERRITHTKETEGTEILLSTCLVATVEAK